MLKEITATIPWILLLSIQTTTALESTVSSTTTPSNVAAPTPVPVTVAPPFPTTTATPTSLSPADSAAQVSSFFAALASASPQQPGSGVAPGAGDPDDASGDSDAGASGEDTESITLPTGAIIAIVLVVVGVIIIGVATATLWYFAKKRSWEIRASIRKSAKRVATAITPRRSNFPKDARRSRRFSRGLTKIDEVPNTPRTRSKDVEKGGVKISAFEVAEPPQSGVKKGWASKFRGK